MSFILWLAEITRGDVAQVGGKGANLGELARARFPVPDAFCVTAQAYIQHVSRLPPQGQIANALDAIRAGDPASLRAASAQISSAILQVELDAALRVQILQAYAQLVRDSSPAVSVRSSSTLEDIAEASAAGQQDTFLNVRGEDAVLEHVKKCWASLWTERAIAYRRAQGLSHHPVTIAVVVQRMIACQSAGVMFTRDVAADQDALVIEANWGLGESVVAGQVTPDRYRVDRATGQEIRAQIAVKAQMTISVADGSGTLDVQVSDSQKISRVLSEAQVCALARLGLDIERHYGQPQDVEWGIADDQIAVLQARPITTRSAGSFFTERLAPDNTLWTSGFFNERFPQPVSPLGWSIVKALVEPLALQEPLRFVGLDHFEGIPISRLYAGHPFVNVRVFQMLYRHFPAMLLPADARRFFPEGDTSLRHQVDRPTRWQFLISALRTFLTEPYWHPWHYAQWNRFVRRYDAEVAAILARIEGQDNPQDLLASLEALMRLSRELLRIHRWSLAYAEILYALLGRLIKAWVGQAQAAELVAQLVSGLENKTTETDLRLWGVGAGRAPLDAFLREYGHRAASLDILYPSYADDPAQVLRLAQDLARDENTIAPPVLVERQAEKRRHATRTLKAELSARWLDRPLPIRRLILAVVIHFAHIYLRLREDQRFYWQKSLHGKRRACLRIGDDLHKKGLLETRDDIFFLTLDEIAQLASRQELDMPPARLAAARKREWSHLRHSPYPPFLRGNAPLMQAGLSADDSRAHSLQGVPASPGLAQGKARRLLDPRQLEAALASLALGDILVTLSTDPAWTPLFPRLGGLVMETGGQLSHGAVVAREYGLPAVVGVCGATNCIPEGALILVDGYQGTVTLLE